MDSEARKAVADLQVQFIAWTSFVSALATDLALSTPNPREVVRGWKPKTEEVLRNARLDTGDEASSKEVRHQAEMALAEVHRALEALMEHALKRIAAKKH